MPYDGKGIYLPENMSKQECSNVPLTTQYLSYIKLCNVIG